MNQATEQHLPDAASQPQEAEQTLRAKGGASVTIVERDGAERIEIRDAEQRLVFEFDPISRKATLCLPEGDLAVRAPKGNIELEAGGTIRMQSKHVQIAADKTELSLREVALTAERVLAKLDEARVVTRRLETVADKLFERARAVFRTATDLHQLKAGRSRAIVEGAYVVRSGHASIESREETKIDGSEIHLG